ncbi:hypothetical protein FRB91_007145 [Serendipita sp. 411]|nr:hypothetical protein FRB91_007145 [Serendipita sp. 411]
MDPTRDTENAARYDQSAPNYSSAGSTTGRLTSDAHSHLETSSNQESLFSYYSARDLSEFFKKIDGRNYNVLNDSYFLPNDEPEWERLEKEHIAFIIGLKSLVPCPDIVNACLAPGPSRSVLDLGGFDVHPLLDLLNSSQVVALVHGHSRWLGSILTQM